MIRGLLKAYGIYYIIAEMKLKKAVKLVKRNYFFSAILLVGLLVGLYIVFVVFFSKPRYAYVKLKVGQGLWWVNTARPNVWFADNIREGDIKYDILGRKQAEIIEVRKYPATQNSQFDVYITAKLKVGFNKRTGEYNFNRSILSVGAPIELQFPKVDVTGTVMEISPEPFNEPFVEKIVYIVNQGGYLKDFPYRYDSIKIGDYYNDGRDKVFEVLDKKLEKNIWSIGNNLTGTIFEGEIDTNQNIIVKARVKLKERKGNLYYGEDNKVMVNSFINFATNTYQFENFNIRKIE